MRTTVKILLISILFFSCENNKSKATRIINLQLGATYSRLTDRLNVINHSIEEASKNYSNLNDTIKRDFDRVQIISDSIFQFIQSYMSKTLNYSGNSISVESLDNFENWEDLQNLDNYKICSELLIKDPANPSTNEWSIRNYSAKLDKYARTLSEIARKYRVILPMTFGDKQNEIVYTKDGIPLPRLINEFYRCGISITLTHFRLHEIEFQQANLILLESLIALSKNK